MSETRDRIVSEAVKDGRDTAGRRFLAFLAVLLLALAAYTVWSFQQYNDGKNDQIEEKTQQAAQGKSLAQQVQDACRDNSKDTADLGQLCSTANDVVRQVTGPAGDPGPTGATGASGPGPSSTQVARAVASYCAGGVCDGKDVTASQVSAAVAQYCNANGECKGPVGQAGADGSTGQAGQDGAKGEPGDPGPPPSDEQITTAVQSYCDAHNQCTPEVIPPDGVVTEGVCELSLEPIEGQPVSKVTGSITLTIQQGGITRQVTINC
jgi:hypothetical protein